MNRQEDLTKVFDKRWKANHNDDVKKARDKEKDFMNKMFNTNINTISNNSVITPGEMGSNLHNNMESANRGINQSKNFIRVDVNILVVLMKLDVVL